MNFKLFHEFIPVLSKNCFELGHTLLLYILRNNENWRLQNIYIITRLYKSVWISQKFTTRFCKSYYFLQRIYKIVLGTRVWNSVVWVQGNRSFSNTVLSTLERANMYKLSPPLSIIIAGIVYVYNKMENWCLT